MKSILKEYREKHNYSTSDLAYYFGGNEKLIIDWEDGAAEPTISECLILSKLYGVSLDEMFSSFDEKTILSKECMDRFEHQVRLNRMTTRWYD